MPQNDVQKKRTGDAVTKKVYPSLTFNERMVLCFLWQCERESRSARDSTTLDNLSKVQTSNHQNPRPVTGYETHQGS